MSQPCSCRCGVESELKLDNHKTILVQRMREVLIEFQAMGMPANEMVADMLAQRVRPVRALAEAERPLYRAALLREYAQLLSASPRPQGAVPEAQRSNSKH